MNCKVKKMIKEEQTSLDLNEVIQGIEIREH